jgi:DNA-binding Lrp family transcriptional regulator
VPRVSFKDLLEDDLARAKKPNSELSSPSLFALRGSRHIRQNPKRYSLERPQAQEQEGVKEMRLAFVMISAETGKESEVLNELKKIEDVKEACLTFGAYDIVAKVEAETREKLEEAITGKVRRLNSLRSTLTMMVMEET